MVVMDDFSMSKSVNVTDIVPPLPMKGDFKVETIKKLQSWRLPSFSCLFGFYYITLMMPGVKTASIMKFQLQKSLSSDGGRQVWVRPARGR